MNATDDLEPIALEVYICAQRRSYIARFATDAQAVAFINGRSATHAFGELADEPLPPYAIKTLTRLYPECEHGLSASNCYGPQHYWFDEDEQRAGLRNGWAA